LLPGRDGGEYLRGAAELPVRSAVLIPLGLLVAALAVGALGLYIFFTERGVANEIKGFVLLLIAAVLAGGGCILWELQAIRKALAGKKDSAT
jgi:hypothetical protein